MACTTFGVLSIHLISSLWKKDKERVQSCPEQNSDWFFFFILCLIAFHYLCSLKLPRKIPWNPHQCPQISSSLPGAEIWYLRNRWRLLQGRTKFSEPQTKCWWPSQRLRGVSARMKLDPRKRRCTWKSSGFEVAPMKKHKIEFSFNCKFWALDYTRLFNTKIEVAITFLLCKFDLKKENKINVEERTWFSSKVSISSSSDCSNGSSVRLWTSYLKSMSFQVTSSSFKIYAW